MAHTIGIGESIVIPQREITEEMHDRRVLFNLAPKNELKNGANAKILRAYTRPRGQEAVEVEVTPDGVKVTALAKGYALVDIIDEISEPSGYDTEFYVVRQPQLETPQPVNPLANLNEEELAELGMERVTSAVDQS